VPAPSTALLTQEARDAWESQQSRLLRPRVEGCQAASAKRRWNASSFAIGITPAFQSVTGETKDFAYAGAALWGTLALRLSTSTSNLGQFIVQGRYRNKEMVPNKSAKGVFFEQDSAMLGLRLLLGEAVRAFVLESEIGRQSPKTGSAKTIATLSGGGQLKLSDDFWLSAAIGGSFKGNPDEQRGMFVVSSLKWALSKEPSIKAP
jgi:hypothetical protein